MLLGRSSLRSMTAAAVGCFSEPSPIDVRSEYRTLAKSRGREAGVVPPMESPKSEDSGDGGDVAAVSDSPSFLLLSKNFGSAKQLRLRLTFNRSQ